MLLDKDRANTRARSRAILLAALAAVTAFALVVLLSCACSRLTSTHHQNLASWDNTAFYQEYGRFYYAKDGVTATRTGVDVSDHQGTIDWDVVAADNIGFAIIRIGYRGTTEGGLYQDELFEYNFAAAEAAGIDSGVYFFSQALDAEEAREEARFALQLLGGREIEYPIVFDHEVNTIGVSSMRTEGMSVEDTTAAAVAFCEEVEAAGYEAMVYGNQYDLARYNLEQLADHPIWYAEYGSAPTSAHYFSIWQYTHEGQVAGIQTPVDLNLDMGL